MRERETGQNMKTKTIIGKQNPEDGMNPNQPEPQKEMSHNRPEQNVTNPNPPEPQQEPVQTGSKKFILR